MAAMSSLLKVSSSLVVNRDSKPSLKWRNPSLLRTTQISLPPSMIKNSSNTTTAGGFIRTIKCSSSNRGSDFRVQCVMNSKNKNCFKKEEEEENPFERFGKLMLKVLKALEKPAVAAILGWILLTKNPSIASSSLRRTAIFLGVWLAYDLCKAIWGISSQYSRLRNGEDIEISVGSVLGLVMLFLCAFLGELTWEEMEGTKITIAHKIVVIFLWMLFGSESWTLTPPPRSKEKIEGSVNTTDTQRSTRLQV